MHCRKSLLKMFCVRMVDEYIADLDLSLCRNVVSNQDTCTIPGVYGQEGDACPTSCHSSGQVFNLEISINPSLGFTI